MLDLFDKYFENDIHHVLLKRNKETDDINCFEMAVEGDCKLFLSSPTVQNVLTDMWYNKTIQKSSFKNEAMVYIMSSLFT